jgi:hypothetical protein
LLIEQILEVVVIRPDNEWPHSEVGAPMEDHLDQPDQFWLISRELRVVWRNGMTEERDRSASLMQDSTKARLGGVAIHPERLGEVWELEDGDRGQCCLQQFECHGHQGHPAVCFSLE